MHVTNIEKNNRARESRKKTSRTAQFFERNSCVAKNFEKNNQNADENAWPPPRHQMVRALQILSSVVHTLSVYPLQDLIRTSVIVLLHCHNTTTVQHIYL